MSEREIIAGRFRELIAHLYPNLNEFQRAEKLGMSRDKLYSIYRGMGSITEKAQMVVVEEGGNYNWVITGLGDMMLSRPHVDSIEARVEAIEKKVYKLTEGQKSPRDLYPGGPEAYDEMIAASRVEGMQEIHIIEPPKYKAAATPKPPKKRRKSDEDMDEEDQGL